MATDVEGDPKVPFSIATTPRFRGRCYSFPWIAPLYLDPYLIMLSVKQGSTKSYFLSLWYDSTWEWTLVSRAISEHATHKANLFICIKMDLALNNLQWLICNKTKTNHTKPKIVWYAIKMINFIVLLIYGRAKSLLSLILLGRDGFWGEEEGLFLCFINVWFRDE